MATKADFTVEEWGRILASPMVAGMAITAADPSGVWGLLKEGMAGGWALLEARQNAQANPLVRAVAEDFATGDGRTAARVALQARFTGAKAGGLKEACIAELRALAGILDVKAAEAGTEGGFLGFGGVAVSEAEKATVQEISNALGHRGTAAP